MNRVEIHKQICDKTHNTFVGKDADYGGAYAETRKEFANVILLFLTIKLNRLKQLMNGNTPNVEESIDDTLLDMADYCIMELTERRIDELTRCEGVCRNYEQEVQEIVDEVMEPMFVLCHVRNCHLNVLGTCAADAKECKNRIADRG